MYEFSVRELTYGNEKIARIGAWMNGFRLRNLKRRLRKHPEMAEIYQAKLRDIEGFAKNAGDTAHLKRMREQLGRILDELNAVLANRPWVSGGQYSLADAYWTVGVARLKFLGVDPLGQRPALAEWYARVKARPSFDEGDVWERFKITRILSLLAIKLGPRLALITLVIAGLGALWWWLV